MSEEPQRSPHTTAWIVTALVAVPLLYLLTLPPLAIFIVHRQGLTVASFIPATHTNRSGNAAITPDSIDSLLAGLTAGHPALPFLGLLGGPPKWLVAYAAPANWLFNHTPLHPPYQAYFEWWMKITGYSA